MCPPATFKSVTGDELCGPCPAHSRAPYRGSTECRCDHGYYRAEKDPKWSPCTRKTITSFHSFFPSFFFLFPLQFLSSLPFHFRSPTKNFFQESFFTPFTWLNLTSWTIHLLHTEPPSAPQNVSFNFADPTSVIITWAIPKFSGGRNDTRYRVDCDICGPTVSYSPSQDSLNETKVVVSGLLPLTSYRFQVYAENGASGHDSSQFSDITVKTQSAGELMRREDT